MDEKELDQRIQDFVNSSQDAARQMAEYADALIAVWDGKSRGTRNMIDEAARKNLKLFVHKI